MSVWHIVLEIDEHKSVWISYAPVDESKQQPVEDMVKTLKMIN
jgi:hypothetical protein